MKATMDQRGVITLQAETPIEAFAISHWVKEALVDIDDIKRGEQCYWRGSKLIVVDGVPK
jgi:hypothetical protein